MTAAVAGREERSPTTHFAIGLARAGAGALIFGLPLLMTMEMWWLGFYMDRVRLAIFLAATVPLLVGLSHVSGFEETFDVKHDVVDAFVAIAVGAFVGGLVLAILGVVRPTMSADEIVGKIALQAIAGSIGALLAQSQLGGQRRDDERVTERRGGESPRGGPRPSTYASQILLMVVGALFLAFNLAPTEEMVLISYMVGPWTVLVLAAGSLFVMHAFVYAVEFRGQERVAPGTSPASVIVRFTIVGYAVALLISAFVLWTFGRLDDTSWGERVTTTLVLGFPAAIGAAAARLIL